MRWFPRLKWGQTLYYSTSLLLINKMEFSVVGYDAAGVFGVADRGLREDQMCISRRIGYALPPAF